VDERGKREVRNAKNMAVVVADIASPPRLVLHQDFLCSHNRNRDHDSNCGESASAIFSIVNS